MTRHRNRAALTADCVADPTARQYLEWLAAKRGIELPLGSVFRLNGIWSGPGKDAELLVPMPGFGVVDVVTMETLDEAGEVERTQRVALAPNGSMTIKADQVRAATGLKNKRTAAPARARFPLDPRQALRMSSDEMAAYCQMTREGGAGPSWSRAADPGAESLPPIAEPSDLVPEPSDLAGESMELVDETPCNSDSVASAGMPEQVEPIDVRALLARLAAVEQVVDQLQRQPADVAPPAVGMLDTPQRGNDVVVPLPRDPRVRAVIANRDQLERENAMRAARRSDAERRAILRAWRFRREMRERADLDRRALEAANGAYRGALDVLRKANEERDAAVTRARNEVARVEALAFDLSAMTQRATTAEARADQIERETAPAIDEAHGRLVKLERDVATWEARAKGAGWRPTFNLAGLMSGKTAASA
ncbi:hypothetical protein [Sphingomonas panaciterrae]|uniref:hypothetical protein n=1 Tax=Sphingomonas panaciterrae TaxID=1462999 RepID=UPI002FF1F7E2